MTRMKRITNTLSIVASSGAARRLPNGYVFAVWNDLDNRDVLAFTETKASLWPLPELQEAEKKDLLDQYHDIIATVGVANGPDSLWWYTWTSSRDRFYSRILGDMELMARFEKACQEGLPQHLVLLCLDPYLASALLSISRRNGIKDQIAFRDRLRWVGQRIKMRVQPLVGGLRACQRALAQKRKSRREKISFGQQNGVRERPLIVTWLKTKNLVDGGPANDTYFGPLPEFLNNGDRSAVLFGDLLDSPDFLPTTGHVNPSLPILSTGDYFSLWGIIKALIRGMISSVTVPRQLSKEDPKLAALIRRDIYNNKSAVVYGLLFESALKRLCDELRPTHIIHSCENNPWERSCAWVAKSMTPEPEVIGFMHCAVLLSYVKIIITEKEKAVRPRPRSLVCTGPVARDIMIQRGGHSPEEVVAGCALRHEYLWDLEPRPREKRPIKNIMVALGGLPTMPGFVQFIFEALNEVRSYHTVLRLYPLDTIETIMADARIPLSAVQTLEFSTDTTLIQDLEKADLVIYNGSTVAIEAGYLGIPLIYVDLQRLLNQDPLFEVEEFKQSVRTPEELFAAIQRFGSMGIEEYLEQRDSLQKYIDGYFVKPTEACASVFLTGSSVNGSN